MPDSQTQGAPLPLRKVAEQLGDLEVLPLLGPSGRPFAWFVAGADAASVHAAALAGAAPDLSACLRELLAALPETGYSDEEAWKAALAARRQAEALLARLETFG